MYSVASGALVAARSEEGDDGGAEGGSAESTAEAAPESED
jgi:hypothetical protein